MIASHARSVGQTRNPAAAIDSSVSRSRFPGCGARAWFFMLPSLVVTCVIRRRLSQPACPLSRLPLGQKWASFIGVRTSQPVEAPILPHRCGNLSPPAKPGAPQPSARTDRRRFHIRHASISRTAASPNVPYRNNEIPLLAALALGGPPLLYGLLRYRPRDLGCSSAARPRPAAQPSRPSARRSPLRPPRSCRRESEPTRRLRPRGHSACPPPTA